MSYESKESCSTCRYYLSGECRRRAPLPFTTTGTIEFVRWPKTRPQDLCGEYVAKGKR